MSRRTDLPDMPLCNGCGACCGPVTVRPDEAKRIKRHVSEHNIAWDAPETDPDTLSFACGFLRKQDDGSFSCAIHSVRPWVCRAFGVIEEMQCPLFPEAATASIPRQQAVRLRLIDPEDKYLGEYFERDYLKRIGGRRLGAAIHGLAASAIERKVLQEPGGAGTATEKGAE